MLKTICPDCGAAFEPSDTRAQCRDCRPKDKGERDKYFRGNRHERGYGNRWARLSKRARELQPFCTDCGRTDDLTADHSMEAWKRFEQGKPIRLRDIDVVCRQCNTDRGAARGDDATDEHRNNSRVEILETWMESQ